METHSCKRQRENIRRQMNEVYFSTFFFLKSHSGTQRKTCFLLESSVVMLLNISLSNGIARQSEVFERREGFQMHREKVGGGTNIA